MYSPWSRQGSWLPGGAKSSEFAWELRKVSARFKLHALKELLEDALEEERSLPSTYSGAWGAPTLDPWTCRVWGVEGLVSIAQLERLPICPPHPTSPSNVSKQNSSKAPADV